MKKLLLRQERERKPRKEGGRQGSEKACKRKCRGEQKKRGRNKKEERGMLERERREANQRVEW